MLTLASGIVSICSRISPLRVLGPLRGKSHCNFLLISLIGTLASIKNTETYLSTELHINTAPVETFDVAV